MVGKVGKTVDPITQFFEFKGSLGPKNEERRNTGTIVDQINEGRPTALLFDEFEVADPTDVFKTLADGKKWTNTGSRIELGVPHGTGRKFVAHIFPTFNVYDNLVLTEATTPAASPLDNMQVTAYPPDESRADYIPKD